MTVQCYLLLLGIWREITIEDWVLYIWWVQWAGSSM